MKLMKMHIRPANCEGVRIVLSFAFSTTRSLGTMPRMRSCFVMSGVGGVEGCVGSISGVEEPADETTLSRVFLG